VYQWPLGLRRRSTAARLLRLWVRIPPVAWRSVCCECCVLSGRGLCDAMITRPEESYWLWCVVVCDQETSWMRRPWPTGGCGATGKKNYFGVINRLKLHGYLRNCTLKNNIFNVCNDTGHWIISIAYFFKHYLVPTSCRSIK